MNSKKYFIDETLLEKDEYYGAEYLKNQILNDNQLKNIDEIIIGFLGCGTEKFQIIIDMFVENKNKFQHIKSLFIGDMDYEECEVSWIEQGDYSNLLKVLPHLQYLTIKGSNNLTLGNINHTNLKSLEIICGGLPSNVIDEIANANLPSLEKLNLYIGIEYYGFDGDINTIKNLVDNLHKFKNLKYLGINNSKLQDDIVDIVLKNDIIKNLEVLDFSNSVLTDKGGNIILNNKNKLSHLKLLDLHYHFLSDDMMKKLENLPFKADLSEPNLDDDEHFDDEDFYPMLTE